MKTLIYILLSQFVCSSLFSQQFYLRGEIKDEAGSPLQNANILLHSSGYIYHSGTYGSFGIISKSQIDSITVYMDGYQRTCLQVRSDEYANIQLKMLPVSASSLRKDKLSSLTSGLSRENQKEWFTGNETYASLIENHFISARRNPNTSLALNIDRASYSNIRRFINSGSVVPPDAVRIEEMLNYFNNSYHEPEGDKMFNLKSFVTSCPWNTENQLFYLNASSRKLNLENLPPSNLVFLVDISGSMDMPNRLPLLQSAFRLLVNNLRDRDTVSIVVYGGVVGIMLQPTGGNEKDKILKAIDELTPGGSTPGESGIKMAYSVARNHFIEGGNNRVILATDGDFNVGLKTEDELDEMITRQRESGIYLTCIGVGMGNYKDSKIQTLARKGNGNFAYFDSFMEAEKVLMKEYTQTLYSVADDVYMDISFNPDLVQEYRLLGFDNKMGAIKDTLSAIEGGEIGSGNSLVAVFEIVPTAYNEQRAPTGGSTEEFAKVRLKYHLPNQPKQLEYNDRRSFQFTSFENIGKSYQFSTSVLMFGLMLKESPLARNISWNDIILMASGSHDPGEQTQTEFVNLVEQTKALYSKLKKKRKKDKNSYADGR